MTPLPPIAPRPCKCGAHPELTEREQHGVSSIQVQCSCGHKGAAILFTRPEQREWARWAAVDGWNLSE